MKKTYVTPEIDIYELSNQLILAASKNPTEPEPDTFNDEDGYGLY